MNSVLIGITSRNRASVLPNAINSALSQNYNNKIVAVFDDASTDDTTKLQGQYPNVDWYFSPSTKGYLFARNKFMQTPGIDFFASLDDDSWFIGQDTLSIAIQYLSNHDDVGAVAFEILSPDQPEQKYQDKVSQEETNFFIGCGHLLRVDIVKKVGGYAANPGYYGGEEKDLCIRLMDAGYKIIRLNGLCVWHDKTSIARDVSSQHRSGVCNDLVFAWRRTPALLLLLALPVKIYKHFVFSLKFKEAALVAPCLEGFKDFFRFLIRGKIERKAVSIRTFKKFVSFN